MIGSCGLALRKWYPPALDYELLYVSGRVLLRSLMGTLARLPPRLVSIPLLPAP